VVLAGDLQYMDPEACNRWAVDIAEIKKMLTGLIKNLR